MSLTCPYGIYLCKNKKIIMNYGLCIMNYFVPLHLINK